MTECPEIGKLDARELSDILDTLQKNILHTPYEDEARVLRGSYGVHLYYLRQRDEKAALPYVAWMRDYHAGKPV